MRFQSAIDRAILALTVIVWMIKAATELEQTIQAMALHPIILKCVIAIRLRVRNGGFNARL